MEHGPTTVSTSGERIFPENKFVLLGLLPLIFILLVFRLDYLPLKFEEPRRALVATEMLISGNYWTPTINGEFYYNKPPLFNWLIAGLFKIFGFSNWVERLPTLLSITGIFALNFFFFRKKIGTQASLLSSFLFLLSGHMLFYFSFQGEIDMTYSFVVIAQVICIFHYFDKRKWIQLFTFSYLLMTVGFLMKGLPSIAFQGLTLLGLFIWHREFKKLFHYAHLVGLLISLGILTGYFYLYSGYNNPELLLAKLTVESARRTTEGQGILLYLIQLGRLPLLFFVIMLPGSLALLFARKFDWKKVVQNKWVKYCFIFLLFNVPLYLISPGTRDRYLYMFLPFIYNIIIFLSFESLVKFRKSVKAFLYIVAGLLASGLVALPFIQEGISLVWSLIVPVLIVGVAFLVRRERIHAVLGFLLVMISLRIYYDMVVFPIRSLSEDNIAATTHAAEVYKITGDEELLFLGTSDERTLALPFRKPVILKEIERLPYQFSYYYSSNAGKIIQWVDKVPTNTYYITGLTDLNKASATYTFEMEGKFFALMKD